MTDQPIPQLKALRERAGLSQTELAFLVGVSVDTIANWENGRRGLDWFERFVRLCTALRCAPQELITYDASDASHASDTSHGNAADRLDRPASSSHAAPLSPFNDRLLQQRLEELQEKLRRSPPAP